MDSFNGYIRQWSTIITQRPLDRIGIVLMEIISNLSMKHQMARFSWESF